MTCLKFSIWLYCSRYLKWCTKLLSYDIHNARDWWSMSRKVWMYSTSKVDPSCIKTDGQVVDPLIVILSRSTNNAHQTLGPLIMLTKSRISSNSCATGRSEVVSNVFLTLTGMKIAHSRWLQIIRSFICEIEVCR